MLLDDQLFGTRGKHIKVPESCSLQSLILFELLARFLSPSQLTSLLHGTSHAAEVCLCVCLSVTLSRSCCRLSSKVATLVEEVFRRAGYGVHSIHTRDSAGVCV